LNTTHILVNICYVKSLNFCSWCYGVNWSCCSWLPIH